METRAAIAWLALALLPCAARAAASASLSVSATVVRGEKKPRPAEARPPAAGERPGAAPAVSPPPPGSLRLVAPGETRSSEAAR